METYNVYVLLKFDYDSGSDTILTLLMRCCHIYIDSTKSKCIVCSNYAHANTHSLTHTEAGLCRVC